MKLIKNVVAVDVCQASDLDGMSRSKINVVSIPSVNWISVPIVVPAKLSIINKVEDKNTIWTSTLVFRTCENFSHRGHLCFRVKLANGQLLLVGSCDRPYCVVSVNDTIPDSMTDSQLQEVTVTLTSSKRPPQIA